MYIRDVKMHGSKPKVIFLFHIMIRFIISPVKADTHSIMLGLSRTCGPIELSRWDELSENPTISWTFVNCSIGDCASVSTKALIITLLIKSM